MVQLRTVRDGDVEQIRDLFVEVYGDDYPYPGFYDLEWLKKAVYDDNVVFLCAEGDEGIVATCSAVLKTGDLDDLVAEIGRLVASPTRRVPGAASSLVQQVCTSIDNRIQFAFAETRTVHPIAQHLFTKQGYVPVGFEPLKYNLAPQRESVAVLANLSQMARELRRNHPRLIPEIAPLAQAALRNLDLPVDIVVEAEAEGYPIGQDCTCERLRDQGITPLLRIERGRVENKEIFGNISLAHSFFHVGSSETDYLVARRNGQVVGAVGFTHDEIDRKVRIFELIEFDASVKGFLLAEVDRLAREELDVVYQEVDVSAYSPDIQRTFERLGFFPAAYCPSMVFEQVERLDVVRMVKLSIPYNLGALQLLDPVAAIKAVVEQGLTDKLAGLDITTGIRGVSPFHGLPDGDLYYVTRCANLTYYDAGARLAKAGDEVSAIHVVVSGMVQRGDSTDFGPGVTIGEFALLAPAHHASDLTVTHAADIIEIDIERLTRLMQKYPQLGYGIMSNLARNLYAQRQQIDS